jgi:hypothetical protein
MIRTLILICSFLTALPAIAQEPGIDTCALQVPPTCALAFDLPGLILQDADPVVLPDTTLRLLATAADGEVALVDLSLADGSILRHQAVDLRLPPGPTFPPAVFGAFATDGQTLVIATGDNGQPQEFRLFDANGVGIGRLPDQALEADFLASDIIQQDWGYDVTAFDLFARLIRQNLIQLQGDVLRGTLYRFDLAADLRQETFTLRESQPALNPSDTFAAYMERRFAFQLDPVGSEDRHFTGEIAAVTTSEGDGVASTVYALDPNQHRVFYDQHLGVENGRPFTYSGARISPDGQFLAVTRTSLSPEEGPEQALMVFRTVTAREVLVAALPVSDAARVLWLPDGRIAVLQSDDGSGTTGFVFGPP